MDLRTRLGTAAFLLGLLAAAPVILAPPAAAHSRPQGAPESSIVTCSSNDMRRNFCHIGQHSSVRMVRQRSDAACERNQSWGVTGDRLWVDHGCRADFEVVRNGGRGDGRNGGRGDGRWSRPDGVILVTCSSNDMKRKFCDVGPNRGVRLAQQRSQSPCELNRSYGVSGDRLWVDRGCRGDFEVIPAPQGEVYVVACNSDDMRRRVCNIGPHASVRLLRQHSQAACVAGRTWGVSGATLWVDRGCRAEFEVTAHPPGRGRPRR
jgi:hypothetical protein